MSKITHANVVVHHFSNFRVTKCVRKTCFQNLPSKTDGPRLRTQFSSLFSRCQGLCMCKIIVFIGKTLPRDFPAQPFPMSKKKSATPCENDFFILFSYFCFFFTRRVYHDSKPTKPLAPEAIKIERFFKSKKKSDESKKTYYH